MMSGGALGLWAWTAHQRQLHVFWRTIMWLPLGMFTSVLLWAIMQSTIPVPDAWAHPIWTLTTLPQMRPTSSYISATPEAGLVGTMRLTTYAAVFWLFLQYCRSERRARQALRWVVAASTLYAVYGIVNFATGNNTLLWFDRWAYHDDLTSTFVNRNTYATFAALGLLCAIAMVAISYRRKLAVSDRSHTPALRRLNSFAGEPLIHAGGAAAIAVAWLQTHSRMGVASGMLGVFLLLALLSYARLVTKRIAAIIAAGTVGLLYFTSGGGATLNRFAFTYEIDRIPLFKLVLDGIKNEPFVGSGYGSFSALFPMYRDASVPSPLDYTQAHNTYLELAFELGIPASVFLISAVAVLVVVCISGLVSRRQSRAYPALAVASAIVIGVHALTDFSIQVPAVALLFSAILGAGVAQSWSASRHATSA